MDRSGWFGNECQSKFPTVLTNTSFFADFGKQMSLSMAVCRWIVALYFSINPAMEAVFPGGIAIGSDNPER